MRIEGILENWRHESECSPLEERAEAYQECYQELLDYLTSNESPLIPHRVPTTEFYKNPAGCYPKHPRDKVIAITTDNQDTIIITQRFL
jgi:alkanesulfonate monooxygenase SsuD/methylene tetrahydromethanopterin reductase-like flavin-dependent oxidoreductase (luciferase family)